MCIRDRGYLDCLYGHEWELTKSPAGAHQGKPKQNGHDIEMTPDAHPIIGSTPVDGFYLLTGFSGHGFMHGPVCGKLMSEILIDGDASTVDIRMLDYNRFSENRLITEYNVV